MTERKVLNKYFPPDYDPSKIPRLRKGDKRRQFNIRTMAPFNMRCTTCNGYIYKAKKFNSRMETAENVDYLGLRHYRFYIRCPLCCAEIIWRTDLENGDYVLEAGAKRNFEALKTAEELEAKRQAEEEEELANNPMKLLEKRTDQSKQEMEMVEVIEDLKQLNQRQAGMEADHVLLRQLWQESEALKKAEEESDEAMIKELLASRSKSDECVEEVLRVVAPQPIFPKSSDTITGDSLNIGSASRLSIHKKPSSSTTYLKRQLQGTVISKKDQSKTGSPAGFASFTSSSSIGDAVMGPTSSKVSRQENQTEERSLVMPPESTVFSLPGITYSDHSDSE